MVMQVSTRGLTSLEAQGHRQRGIVLSDLLSTELLQRL